jgi:crotonobetaine/carnitine-CoA ligase
MMSDRRAQGDVEILFRQRAADHPDATWLNWEGTQISWGDSLSNIQRVANGLVELGLRAGDRVAILLPNCPEFLWTHFATVFCGALSVPVNTSQRGHVLRHILTDCEAAIAVVSAELAPVVLDARPKSLRSVVVVGDAPGDTIPFDVVAAAADREPEIDVHQPTGGLGIMYTSGTTGPPKGVVATGYDLTPLEEMLELAGVHPGETMYTPLPLFHGNALVVSVLGSIMCDAQIALDSKFSASRFWDRCREVGAVQFNALGGMMSILLKQPERPDDADNPVRVVLSAGAPADRWVEFEQRFGVRIVEWFGMVDAPGILINREGRIGSIGKPVAGLEYRVVDDDDHPLPAGRVGELTFRHEKGQLTHYHRQPEATAHAYRNGWFHSGDLAEQDEDGFFFYRGRKKESMRRRGENISAWEIETVLNAHPAVLESAAYGVPSELGEDEVMVSLVLREGYHAEPAELLDHCDGKMAAYAVPRYIDVTDALPKTGTHRIQYAALKETGITPTTWDRDRAARQNELTTRRTRWNE